MEKLTKIFFVLLSAIALTGCAEQTKPVPDPEPIEIQIRNPAIMGLLCFRRRKAMRQCIPLI